MEMFMDIAKKIQIH